MRFPIGTIVNYKGKHWRVVGTKEDDMIPRFPTKYTRWNYILIELQTGEELRILESRLLAGLPDSINQKTS